MRTLTHLAMAAVVIVSVVATTSGPASATGHAPLSLAGTGTHEPLEVGRSERRAVAEDERHGRISPAGGRDWLALPLKSRVQAL